MYKKAHEEESYFNGKNLENNAEKSHIQMGGRKKHLKIHVAVKVIKLCSIFPSILEQPEAKLINQCTFFCAPVCRT